MLDTDPCWYSQCFVRRLCEYLWLNTYIFYTICIGIIQRLVIGWSALNLAALASFWKTSLHSASFDSCRLRACSYGAKLSRLARKHFDKFTSEISASTKIVWKVTLRSYETKSFPVYRDLACWQARSRYTGKYLSHVNATYSIFSRLPGKPSHMNRTKLSDESKCFLASRDNFAPYEQALNLTLACLSQISLQTTDYLYQQA